MSKVLCLFATEKGYTTLAAAIEQQHQESIGCVVTFKETNVTKSYHQSIEALCSNSQIPFYYWEDVKSDLLYIIATYKITTIVAIAWKYLLPLSINLHIKNDIIIFHDSLLPRFRGFAPTPTAIICGEKQVGVSVLYATDETDKGDIILQKSMDIEDTEYVGDIIKRLSLLYAEAFLELLDHLDDGPLLASPQNETLASYSIWRSPDDCNIDWTESAQQILNLVRAVGPPYTGAFSYIDGEKIVIRKVSLEKDLHFEIRTPGKIWSIKDNIPCVICGSGMLKIIEACTENGDIYIFNRLRVRFT